MSAEKRALMGARLKEERNRLNLSQDEFGLLCDVKRRTLQDWERGVNAPSGEFLSVAHQHGVDVLYVITGTHAWEATGPNVKAFLTDQDREILDGYRAAKGPVRDALHTLIGAIAGKKNEP